MTKEDIPNTWPALIVWAGAKYGIGIIGFALLVPVYQDFQKSNARFDRLIEANIAAITALAQEVRSNTERCTRVEDAINRINHTPTTSKNENIPIPPSDFSRRTDAVLNRLHSGL